ncbi:hypothetical protein SFRURICE_002846 [Spodoptera frugiperda]|nr:hypothetical protein SFRURICE_002846 [Spodoptera frugiperda]
MVGVVAGQRVAGWIPARNNSLCDLRIVVPGFGVMGLAYCHILGTISDTVLPRKIFRVTEKCPVILCPTRELNPKPLVMSDSQSYQIKNEQ